MSEEHKVNLPFHAQDHASGAIHKIAHATEHLGHTAEHTLAKLTELGTAVAGLAGGIGFERLVETGKESLEQIKKMAALTGTPAVDVAAMRDAFEQSGLHAETLARVVTSLGKKTLALEEGSKALVGEAKRWGVDLTHGPERALISMAAAVQKNKIGVGEVSKLLKVGGEEAGAMLEFLKKGPTEIQEMVEHAKKLNVHLTDPEAMERFERFHEASVKIHESWRRIAERLVIGVAPAMERMSEKLSTWIDRINVEKFVDPLVKGMELAVAHARTLGKIMLANAVLERTTGAGVFGTGMRVFGGAGRLVSGVGASVSGAASSSVAAIATNGGVIGRVLGPAMAPIVRLFSAFSSLGPVVGGLLSFAAKATIVTAIVSAVVQLGSHSERFKKVAADLWKSVQKIGTAIMGVFNTEAVQWLGEKLIWAASKFAEGVAYLLRGLATVLGGPDKWRGALTGVHSEHGRQAAMSRALQRFHQEVGDVLETTVGGIRTHIEVTDENVELLQTVSERLRELRDQEYEVEAHALELKEQQVHQMEEFNHGIEEFLAFQKRWSAQYAPHGVPTKPSMVQDFRGSRFDIEQKFAEGFDADRIAVAFQNDMAKLGERRMTHGLVGVTSAIR